MIKKYNITVNGNTYEVEVEELGSSYTPVQNLQRENTSHQAHKITNHKPAPQGNNKNIVAPMPGIINDINVNISQNIKKGDVLLILEAMKMENEIISPIDGKIDSINISKGSSVSAGDLLITIV